MNRKWALLLLMGGALPLAVHAAPAFYAFAGGAFIRGPENASTMVPDVVGSSLAAADATLEAAGLDTGVVVMTCSAVAANQVLAQVPAAGELVAPFTLVDLTASNGVACRNSSSHIGIKIGIGL